MNWFYDSLIIGAWSFVWVNLLTQPSEIFDFIPRIISQRLYKNGVRAYKKKIMKVLFECSKCHAGQWALWSFPFITEGYRFLNHVGFVSVAILTGYILDILQSFYKKSNN